MEGRRSKKMERVNGEYECVNYWRYSYEEKTTRMEKVVDGRDSVLRRWKMMMRKYN